MGKLSTNARDKRPAELNTRTALTLDRGRGRFISNHSDQTVSSILVKKCLRHMDFTACDVSSPTGSFLQIWIVRSLPDNFMLGLGVALIWGGWVAATGNQ